MEYKTRDEQLQQTPPFKTFAVPGNDENTFSDSYLDGQLIGQKSVALNWIEENDVHQAPSLSRATSSSRWFLGPQELLIRDDVRFRTFVLVPESSGLSLATYENGHLLSKEPFYSGKVQRAHIIINKYTGKPDVLFVAVESGQNFLYLNKQKIESAATKPDFPFAALAQPPIGHVASDKPKFGLISYKCRDSGKVFVRSIKDGDIQPEKELPHGNYIGGADFAISDDKVLFRLNEVINDKIVTKYCSSLDQGNSFSELRTIDLEDDPIVTNRPANSAVFVDYTSEFHIPVVGETDTHSVVLDFLPDRELAVESILTERQRHLSESLRAFPKKPSADAALGSIAFGDGITDGAGIIATALEKGAILSSNSQSGGFHYPENAFINYDMPRAYCLKTTECYTRPGAKPNTVSMDYLFLEADSFGRPISQDLLFETWDMPLPSPELSAKLSDGMLVLKIQRDGWYFPGQTTFSCSDPSISIEEVELSSGRTAKIKLSGTPASESTVSFTTRNRFLAHEATAKIEDN